MGPTPLFEGGLPKILLPFPPTKALQNKPSTSNLSNLFWEKVPAERLSFPQIVFSLNRRQFGCHIKGVSSAQSPCQPSIHKRPSLASQAAKKVAPPWASLDLRKTQGPGGFLQLMLPGRDLPGIQEGSCSGKVFPWELNASAIDGRVGGRKACQALLLLRAPNFGRAREHKIKGIKG